MRYGYVVIVIALSQLVLLLLACALAYAQRSRNLVAAGIARERGSSEPAASARRLLKGDLGAAEVLVLLRNAAHSDTAYALVMLGMERVRHTERASLAAMLREEPWVAQTIEGADSRLWWKRLAAARALSLVASAGDRERILNLLSDGHPAVQSAATASLAKYADRDLLIRVIDGLSLASPAVRTYQLRVLAGYAPIVGPMLLDRIRSDAPPHKLYAYIHAAGRLDDATCMSRVAELSTHPHPEVRVAVARVLRSNPGDVVHVKLLSMLRDPDWRVRAQAARGLSAIADERSIAELSRALTDANWWVRFRAGLALASMGEPGRDALVAALDHTDRYARDMATLVSGLSTASVTELSAG
jgi:HEAT repeat protein